MLIETFIALFQTKDGSSQADAEEFLNAAKEMVGQIPGLSSVEGGKVLGSPAVSAAHTFGFDWAFVLKLEREQDLPVYEQHPAHQPYVSTLVAVYDELAYTRAGCLSSVGKRSARCFWWTFRLSQST